jgi:hypothetical protein
MRFYQVRYACNHIGILSETQMLRTSVKAERISRATKRKENLYTCNACLNAEQGYWHDTKLQPIVAARKMSPTEIFQSGYFVRARG